MFLIVTKLLVTLCLLILFFFMFGKSALNEFMEREVRFKVKKVGPQPLDLPAITVCLEFGSSWKKEACIKNQSNKVWIDQMCDVNSSSEIGEFFQCLEERTFSKEEILFDVYFQERKLNVEWNNLFQNFEFGTCQTAVIKEKIDSPATYLIIYLNSTLEYRIFLHDPRLFLMSINSKAFHRTEIGVADRSVSQLIEATQYQLFSREAAHCQEEEQYNFSACVEHRMAEMVGCRLFEHGSKSTPELDQCNNLSQVYRHFDKWTPLFFENNEKIVEYTGCKMPCKFMRYDKSQEPTLIYNVKQDPELMLFGISFSTNMMTVMEEVYSYPYYSFIAEFGGALGLFLGFSFMTFWDIVENIINKIKSKQPNRV